MDPRLTRRERREVRTAKVNRRGARVLIFDRAHPHCGQTGYVIPDDLIKPGDGGPPMVRVDLDPDAGTSHCYAEAAQLMPCTHSYRGGEAG